VRFFLKHFWLFFLGLMLINVAILRPKMLALATEGRATRDDVDRFVRGAVIVLIVYSLAAEIIVLAAGWPNPLCVYTEPLTSAGVLASLGLTVAAWLLLLWWVWRGQGAHLLGRLGPALVRGPVRSTSYSPRQVQLAVTSLIALILVGLPIALSIQPPELSCHFLPM
jgi:hypothetical protein